MFPEYDYSEHSCVQIARTRGANELEVRYLRGRQVTEFQMGKPYSSMFQTRTQYEDALDEYLKRWFDRAGR